MNPLDRFRWWLVRLLVPKNTVYFSAGKWNLGGALHLKPGQKIVGAGKGRTSVIGKRDMDA